jgi:hypothetical protein
MDEQFRDILQQMDLDKIKKLIKELEGMADEDYRNLIEFLKSFV